MRKSELLQHDFRICCKQLLFYLKLETTSKQVQPAKKTSKSCLVNGA